MTMMEQQKHGLVCCEQLPPLRAKYPWLVAECQEDDGIRGHYFYNINDPLSSFRCRIPELLGKHIRGFFHGWVVLSNNNMWSVWNPLTSKIIRLPPLNMLKDGDFDDDIKQFCLSSAPNDPGSVLLLTRTNKPAFVFCRLDCKRKKLRWTEMSYAKQLKKITIDGGLLHSLTCCNGKVYALSTGGSVANFVIQIDIVVEDKEVVIKLLLFGPCPSPNYVSYDVDELIDNYSYFLKGSSTELFCILVEGTKKTIFAVTLFKLDMTSIKWEELERLKGWDLTNKRVEELIAEDIADLFITAGMWEEMSDLKGALFFVDFVHGCSIFYNSVIASELGGYIHIRGEMDNIIFTYHVNYKTILPSTIPFPVLPTSHVLMWEYRLEDDYGEAKCIVDSKQQADAIVVRSVTNDEVGFNESRLLSIPFDILEMIMKFCVGVEYLNFRATCKQCHLAAPLSQCRNETSLRRLQSYSLVSPWLMVLDKNRGINTFTDPMLGDHYFMKNSQISILKGSGIYCCRFGWLLVRVMDEDDEFKPHLVFFNPFTKDIRKLPVSYRTFESLCFTEPPTSPNCMAIGFISRNLKTCAHIFYVAPQPIPTFDAPEELADYLHALGDGLIEPTWRTLELGDNISSIRFPTFHGGDLYALCNEGKLIVFKHLLEEDYSWKVIEAKVPGSGCKSEAQYYMMKCDQHLLVVIVGKFENSVKVFKHNDFTEEWDKMDDLGKHMIYISDTTCLCIDAQTPEMGNKIYFPCLHPTNGKVVFYSLETCLFHTFNGRNMEQYLGGLFSTVHHHNPLAWIEPSWC